MELLFKGITDEGLYHRDTIPEEDTITVYETSVLPVWAYSIEEVKRLIAEVETQYPLLKLQ